MAIDIYLQIEGIKGESQDDAHKDWIEVTKVHWAIQQPKSATSSTAGGHTAERAYLTEITLSKLTDLATPILLQTCSTGKTLPRAKLEFFRADGNRSRVKYFSIEVENVLIGRVKPHLDATDSFMVEDFNLKFSKVRWAYTQQRIGGGSGGNTAGGWDLSANKTV